jgi:hypothetical protein
MSRRRRPNRTESIDHQPGPSIAIAPQMQTSSIPSFGSSELLRIIRISRSTAKIPATGVQSPMSSSPPEITIVSGSSPASRNPSVMDTARPAEARYPPEATRNRRRPAPGHPFGNIENRRCKDMIPFALNFTRESFPRKRQKE